MRYLKEKGARLLSRARSRSKEEARPRPRSKTLAVLAPLAAAAAIAVVPSMASAATQLQFAQGGSPFEGPPLEFSSVATSEVQVLQPKESTLAVECKNEEGAKTESEGAITGPQEDEVTVSFRNCTALGLPCTSPEAGSGEIVVQANSYLVWGFHDGEMVPSELIYPATETFPPAEPGPEADQIAEFNCGGLVHVEVRGAALGSIEPLDAGEHHEFTLTFDQEGGVQKSGTEYVVCSDGTPRTAFLESEIGETGEFVQSAEETTQQLVLEGNKKGEIRGVEC